MAQPQTKPQRFYITRAPDSGEVTGLTRAPQGQAQMADDSPEVVAFQQAAGVKPWPPVQSPGNPRRGVVFCKRAPDAQGNPTGPLTAVLLEPEGERLREDHADVVAFIVKDARGTAQAAIDAAMDAKFNSVKSDATKAELRTAMTPFEGQLAAATTPAAVESIQAAALAAVEAL